MPHTSIQAILSRVEKPSRYLGTEVNAIRKTGEIGLRVGLAFPDLYEIGTSHFGLQILYDILNRDGEIAAERIYTPAPDMAKALKAEKTPLFTLETRTPLAELDMLGFSLLYELNYTGVLSILDLAGIPFYAKDRSADHPLIFAGGPCTCNPEPMAPFFDAMLTGDGEEQLHAVCRAVLAWKKEGGKDRKALLKELAKMDGVYVPSFFTATWDAAGFQHLAAESGVAPTVRKAVMPSLEEASFPTAPVLPFGKPVHDRLRLEIARGCTRGCRFCQAGILYRPVRERSVARLLEITEAAIDATGYDDLSLLSLSTGDYGCLPELMEHLMSRYAAEQRAVSLPSIRAGRLTPRLMEQIKRVRKTGFTIAPEAGSQRLRDVINKNITEEQIVETVENAFSMGWEQIKLYFMIGLPTETEADLEGIVALADRLRRIKTPRNKWGKVTVSVGTFIPKPHAPFQWAGMISLSEAQDKIRFLKDRLKLPGVQMKWQDPRISRLEGLFSRGDRHLAPLLVKAYESGCILDGWSDWFRQDLWDKAISECGIDVDFFTTRPRDLEEPLPWDHMDVRVSRKFLKSEWEKAVTETLTPDCREGKCSACGICDFKTISPEVFDAAPVLPEKDREGASCFHKLTVAFEKVGPARFFGHLEMVQIFLRAIRMADVSLKFSEGFHPKPQIRFGDSLPLGMESRFEQFSLTVGTDWSAERLMASVNPHLPEGLVITGCGSTTKNGVVPQAIHYLVADPATSFDPKALEEFLSVDEWIVTKTNKKGKPVDRDLKTFVSEIRLEDAALLSVTIRVMEGRTVRPSELLATVFAIPEERMPDMRIMKTGIVPSEGR